MEKGNAMATGKAFAEFIKNKETEDYFDLDRVIF
jgi:hypothetical protein